MHLQAHLSGFKGYFFAGAFLVFGGVKLFPVYFLDNIIAAVGVVGIMKNGVGCNF